MTKYRIVESVGGSTQAVHSYADLEIHHPSRHGHEPGRQYDAVDGRREEVLSSHGSALRSRDGYEFVSKDFVLLDGTSGSSNIPVPAPVSGVITVNRADGLVQIFDKAGGELIAQVRHMDLRKFSLHDGDRIEYGQPMGLQSGINRGIKQFGTHTHIDFNVNHLDAFKQYLRDLDSGAITTDKYPALLTGSLELQDSRERMTSLNDPQHRDYPLFQQTFVGVYNIDARVGRQPNQHSENIAAALTVEARRKGMTQVDQVMLSEDGSRMFAVQTHPTSGPQQVAWVATGQAVQRGIATSTIQLALIHQEQKLTAAQQPAIIEPLPSPHRTHCR